MLPGRTVDNALRQATFPYSLLPLICFHPLFTSASSFVKVLRVWLERKTLPESIVRRHLRELESFNESSFTSAYSRRPSKNERALNDPVREMEGMLVDEYGRFDVFLLLFGLLLDGYLIS